MGVHLPSHQRCTTCLLKIVSKRHLLLQSYFLPSHTPSRLWSIKSQCHIVRTAAILSLLPSGKERFLRWRDEHGTEHPRILGLEDENALTGPIGDHEQNLLEAISNTLYEGIWDNNKPDSSKQFVQFFAQLRDYYLLVRVEREYYRQLKASLTGMDYLAWKIENIPRRLDYITRGVDVELLPDDEECIMCKELFKSPRVSLSGLQESLPELPVRLPCGHIVGRDCLKIWIRAWNLEVFAIMGEVVFQCEGKFQVCALCNKEFGLMFPDREESNPALSLLWMTG
ncbi:hypothetical protein B0J14DRAFT_581876 [Halenospora varia]|nr:hypothetical protein B0J14DRAFT_581876 [Halenospora varia]